MGHVATVVVSMDLIDRIKDDKDFGNSLYYACLKTGGTGRPTDISCTGVSVMEVHHADYFKPVFAGAYEVDFNTQTYFNPNESIENLKVRILKDMAAAIGYRVSKISKRK